MTPLRRHVPLRDVFKFYLPMDLEPIGATTIEPVGRTDQPTTPLAFQQVISLAPKPFRAHNPLREAGP